MAGEPGRRGPRAAPCVCSGCRSAACVMFMPAACSTTHRVGRPTSSSTSTLPFTAKGPCALARHAGGASDWSGRAQRGRSCVVVGTTKGRRACDSRARVLRAVVHTTFMPASCHVAMQPAKGRLPASRSVSRDGTGAAGRPAAAPSASTRTPLPLPAAPHAPARAAVAGAAWARRAGWQAPRPPPAPG